MTLNDEDKKEVVKQLRKLYDAIDAMDRDASKIWELLFKAKLHAEDIYNRQAHIATIAAGTICEQLGIKDDDLWPKKKKEEEE